MNSNSSEEGTSTHNSTSRILRNDNDNSNDHAEVSSTTVAEDNDKSKTAIVIVEEPAKVVNTGISSSQSCPESLATQEMSLKNTEKIRRRVDVICTSFTDKMPSKKASQPLQVLPTAITSSPLIVSPTRLAGHEPELKGNDVEQLA